MFIPLPHCACLSFCMCVSSPTSDQIPWKVLGVFMGPWGIKNSQHQLWLVWWYFYFVYGYIFLFPTLFLIDYLKFQTTRSSEHLQLSMESIGSIASFWWRKISLREWYGDALPSEGWAYLTFYMCLPLSDIVIQFERHLVPQIL